MAEAIKLTLDVDDRLAEPPLLDALHYEPEVDGFSITFVPSFGDDPTLHVFVRRESTEGRQVAAYLYRIQQLIHHRVEKVVHRGGGDYSLRLPDGTTMSFGDQTFDQNWVPEVFDRLKQTAEVAEAAYALHTAVRR